MFFGATADAEGYAWCATFHAEGFGQESSDAKSWYHGDFDDQSGATLLRIAAPSIALGSALALAGLLAFTLGGRPKVGGSLAGGAAVALGTGTWLMAFGINDLFDGNQEWTWGFWLLVGATVVAGVAFVVNLLATPIQVPLLERKVAGIVLVVNLLLPGVGTFVAGRVGKQPMHWKALLQLLLAPIVLGWVWALQTSILCVQRSPPKIEVFQ